MSRKSTAKRIKEEAAVSASIIDNDGTEHPINPAGIEKLLSSNMTVVKNETVEINIRKAKIGSHGTMAIVYEKILEDGGRCNVAEEYPFIVHEDLRAAYDELIPHLVLLCEMKEYNEAWGMLNTNIDLEDSTLQNIECRSFSINESGEGVVLSGLKKTEQKVINYNSPFTKWEEDYKFMSQLRVSIEKLKEEIKMYMDGKCSQRQLEMELDEEELEQAEDIS